MKKILKFISILGLMGILTPLSVFAQQFAVQMVATSTATPWVSPNKVNGVLQAIRATYFIGTSTTGASIFPYASTTALTVSGLNTSGSVIFVDANAGLSQNNGAGGSQFIWDNTNKSLGLTSSLTTSVVTGSSLAYNSNPFVTGLADWTMDGGTGWTLNAGGAQHTSGNTNTIFQTSTTTIAGVGYQINYTVSAAGTGNIRLLVNGTQLNIGTAGAKTNYFIGTGNDKIQFQPSVSTATKTITAVIIQALSPTIAPLIIASNGELRANSNSSLFYGSGAGTYNVNSGRNIGIGNGAMPFPFITSDNLAIGASTLALNLTGGFNVALGNNVLSANTTGANNVGLGFNSLLANTTGTSNMGMGVSALQVNSSGSNNVAVGASAGSGNTTGSSNLYMGINAGTAMSSGSNNVFLGPSTGGLNTSSGSGNVIVGSNISLPTNSSNAMTIGNLLFATGLDGSGTGISSGSIGIGTTTPNWKLSVAGVGSFDDYVRASYFIATTTTATSSFAGNLTIGTAVPLQLDAFGSQYYQFQISNNVNDFVGGSIYNVSTGSNAGSGLFFQNANSNLGGIGALQKYYAGFAFGGSNWNGVPLGFGGLPANGFAMYNTDGKTIIASATSTGEIDFYTGPGTFGGGTPDMMISSAGSVAIGTSTPAVKFHVASSAGSLPTFSAGTVGLFQNNANSTDRSRVSIIGGATGFSVLEFGYNTLANAGAIQYDNTLNTLSILAGGSTRATILGTNGNFGVSTSSPGSVFSVGNVTNLTAATSSFYGTGGVDIAAGCFAVSHVCIGGSSGSGTVGSGTTGQIPYYASNGTTLTATTTIFIGPNQNVGIGTTTGMNSKLTLWGTDTGGLAVFNSAAPAAGTGAGISGYNSTIPTGADQRLGFYTLGANDGVANRNSIAIQGFSSQAWTQGSAFGAYMTLATTPTGSTARAEAIRISQNQLVGIGTTTPNTRLDVNGDVTIESGATYVGMIVCYATGGKLGHISVANILVGSTTCTPN